MLTLLIVTAIGYLIHYSECQCTWPTQFKSSTWIDSEKGSVVFDTTTMTGWAFSVQIQAGATSQILNTWECVTYNDTYLVMKTIDTFTQFVTNIYKGYRCLELTQLTGYSYRYYEITPTHATLDGTRLFISEDQGLTSMDDVCLGQFRAEGSEFKVMLKSGFESAAKIYCPYDFLANHTFIYTESSVPNTCVATDTGTIDVCSNNTELAFVSPTCVTSSFYSDAIAVWCVDVVPVGTDIFFSLYNGQQSTNTLDDTTYFQFSCAGVNDDNTQISVTPNSCKPSQNPGAVPVDSLGNRDGAVLTITVSDTACPPCPGLSSIFRGNVTIATAGAVTTATYACESNYTLSGENTRTCQSNGTWSGSAPSCACPVLSDPTNGTVSTSSDSLTATYSCGVGTILVGSVTVTCDITTNVWSASPSTCNDCQTLTNPTNGSLTLSSDGLTSSVTYVCDVGTSLNGLQTRTCQTDGTWSNTAPTCTSCTTLTHPDSGNVTVSSNGSLSTAVYLCANGYSLQGSNTATCGTSGIWDTDVPSCNCDTPPSPTNGSVTVSTDLMTATYTCNSGTSLNGSVTRTCLSDGTGWSNTDPICVTCNNVTVATNGTYTQSTNGTVTMVTFNCDVGTSLIGDSTSYCLSDGTWSSTNPNCSQCDALAQPSSGNYTLSSDGVTTTAAVSCEVGTTISGGATISCLENGTWSTTNTSITCVSCSSLGTLSAGLISLSSNGTATTAQFDCAQGYGVVGESTATCHDDGTWSATTPACVLTSASTEDTSSGNSLLPVVIVLAILATAFAVAFGILLYVYFKSKRENELKSLVYDQRYDTIDDDNAQIKTSKKIPFAKAPMDHQRHVMNAENLTASRAPSGFSFKDSFGVEDMASYGGGRVSESITPRSLASTTLPLHLVREATSSSMLDQPAAPWSSTKTKSTTPRTPRTPRAPTSPDSVSNPRTPRKKRNSLRKTFEEHNATSLLSLEEPVYLKEEQKHVNTLTADNIAEARRRKKKTSVLVKAKSLRNTPVRSSSKAVPEKQRTNKNVDDAYETDVPSVDIDDELNSSRRLYTSMYSLLSKQETVLDSALQGSSVGGNGSVPFSDKRTSDRRGHSRTHSTSPVVRATTPVKHSLQINDPQTCITPRSNSFSTVQ